MKYTLQASLCAVEALARGLSIRLSWHAPTSLMNGSAMGSVQFDLIYQAGCASLRSPVADDSRNMLDSGLTARRPITP